MTDNIIEFSIHEIGDATGKTWTGEFKGRKFLSHRQQLERDRILRTLLGDNPQYSLQIDRATKISACRVGLTEFPEFWKESDGGLDLLDENVLDVVYGNLTTKQQEARDAVKAKAEAAKKALKADAEKPAEDA